MINDVEILKLTVVVLCAIATAFGSTIVAMIVWHAKSIIASISELGKKMEAFERRVTRLEARTHWRVHHKVGND